MSQLKLPDWRFFRNAASDLIILISSKIKKVSNFCFSLVTGIIKSIVCYVCRGGLMKMGDNPRLFRG